jgi:2-isopropylmalate synthase
LRDGQQTPGVDFSLEDKILVARMLDELGIDYVEGRLPWREPDRHGVLRPEADTAGSFHGVRDGQARRAFGGERSRSAGSPRGEGGRICFVGKAWDFHVRLALGCGNEENLDSIRASVAAA